MISTSSLLLVFVVVVVELLVVGNSLGEEYVSVVGDPGMKRDGLRVALESWNFCNEVGHEAPNMGSPRLADCFDLENINPHQYSLDNRKAMTKIDTGTYKVIHRVTEKDNKLGFGNPPGYGIDNADVYAAVKEIYLGDKCEVRDDDPDHPWQFWMIMLKNGNMDASAGLCPKDGKKVAPPLPGQGPWFPCFSPGNCMNQPLVYHNYTSIQHGNVLKGGFYGTWDLDADVEHGMLEHASYYSVDWEKNIGEGSWKFHHVLKPSQKYPWPMLYLRSDATRGFSGGYHYSTRGMTKIVPESPNFKVRVTLDIKRGGGPSSQFYLMDMGSCWKNSGLPCDGDVTSDVTRYSEMIINPAVTAGCTPTSLQSCPPYHTFANGTRVHRSDRSQYPYAAYHEYCSPGNAEHAEAPFVVCDPYSNPQPQEIVQILPHPVWGEYGYPTNKGQGWVGDARTWELDVGRMSQNLYFYQDPDTVPVKRSWPSLDLGTEIYISRTGEVAEWTVSDFDIIVPKPLLGNA